jgi:hypothetical protein
MESYDNSSYHKIYEKEINSLIEYLSLLIPMIILGKKYNESKKIEEKREISEFVEDINNFIKKRNRTFHIIGYDSNINEISAYLKELLDIRNILTHHAHESLMDDNLREIINKKIKPVYSNENVEIPELIHCIIKKLKKALRKYFKADIKITKEGFHTYLSYGMKKKKISPFIIKKNNKIYVLNKLYKRKSDKIGNYRCLFDEIINDDTNNISEIEEVLSLSKFGLNVEYDNYIYKNENNSYKICISKYEDKNIPLICITKIFSISPNIKITNTYKLEENYNYFEKEFNYNFRESEEIIFKCKIYYENDQNNFKEKIFKINPVQKNKGDLEIQLLVPHSKEIRDGEIINAIILIKNTGNISKKYDLRIESCNDIEILAKNNNCNFYCPIYLNPYETITEKFAFKSYIFSNESYNENKKFGIIKDALTVKIFENRNTIKEIKKDLNIYKRFKSLKMIDRNQVVENIKCDLIGERDLVHPDFTLWHIIGSKGVGKTKLRGKIREIANEFNYDIIEMQVISPNKNQKISKTKDYSLLDTVIREKIIRDDDFYVEINSIKEDFENKYFNLLKKYILKEVKNSKKGVFFIIDDYQYASKIEQKNLCVIFEEIKRKVTADEILKDVKFLILSRPCNVIADFKKISKEISLKGLPTEDCIKEMIKDIFDPNVFPDELIKKIIDFAPEKEPFYIEGFLEELYLEKLIYLDKGKWQCDLDRIKKYALQENFLLKQIGKSPILQTIIYLVCFVPDINKLKLREIMKKIGYSDLEINIKIRELFYLTIFKEENDENYKMGHDIITEKIKNSIDDVLLKEIIEKLYSRYIKRENYNNCSNLPLSDFSDFLEKITECQHLISHLNNVTSLIYFTEKIITLERNCFLNNWMYHMETNIKKMNYYDSLKLVFKKIESKKEDSLEVQDLIKSSKYLCSKTNMIFMLSKMYHDFYINFNKENTKKNYEKVLSFKEQITNFKDNTEEKVRYFATLVWFQSLLSYYFEENEYIACANKSFYLMKKYYRELNEKSEISKLYTVSSKEFIMMIGARLLGNKRGSNQKPKETVEMNDFIKCFPRYTEELSKNDNFHNLYIGHLFRGEICFNAANLGISLNSEEKKVNFSIAKFISGLKGLINFLLNRVDEVEKLSQDNNTINERLSTCYFYLLIFFIISIFDKKSIKALLPFIYSKGIKKLKKREKIYFLNKANEIVENCIEEYKILNGHNTTNYEFELIRLLGIILIIFKYGTFEENKNELYKSISMLHERDKYALNNSIENVFSKLKPLKDTTTFYNLFKREYNAITKILSEFVL